MNTPEQNIRQAVKSIGIMNDSLHALCDRTLPINPKLFAVMAEGPMEQIRDLLNQIESLAAEEVQISDSVQEEALAS
jgi:hypothetical protein